MDATELKYQRLNTRAFIATKPSSLILVPIIRTKTASMGHRDTEGEPRDPQTFRIIELGANTAPPIIQLTDGQQREADFWLLGEHDAVCEINDFWVAEDGRVWEVGDIVRDNGYEMRALVSERGK